MDIEVKSLNFNQGKQRVLHNVNFSLGKAQILVVYGSSGSGKSTLLRLVAGLERPAGGEIIFNGEAVSSENIMLPSHKRHCSMIFQQLALWPHMTVDEHLNFGHQHYGKKYIASKIIEILKWLELEGKGSYYPSQLSGGEQQRLAIGRAIITEPQFLLLDEPLNNLDNLLQQKIINILLSLKKKECLPMIYVTHSLAEVMQLADKVLVLKQGTQVFFDSRVKFITKFHESIEKSVHWYTNMEENK